MQESGLMEIIPLICTSVIWGQYPVFCHPVLPLGSLLGVSAVWLWLGRIEGRRRRGNRGWNGCMASSAQWVWVWANSGRSWRAGNPGMLQSMGSQWVRHDWATGQQQYIAGFFFFCVCLFPSCVPKGLTSSLTQREVAAIIDDSDILCLLVWEAVFYFSTVKVLIMRKMFCNCVG